MAKYKFTSFYDLEVTREHIPFVCPLELGGCGEEHEIKIGQAGELETIQNPCYFLESNPDFETEIAQEWRDNYRDKWLKDTKTETGEQEDDKELEKHERGWISRSKCYKCGTGITATPKTLIRYRPRFWGLKKVELLMCGKCLGDNFDSMPKMKQNLYILYQRSNKFYPGVE